MRAVFAAGGTAGHIHPALATAAALNEKSSRWDVSFVGSNRGIGQDLLLEHGHRVDLIDATPAPRKLSARVANTPRAIWHSVEQALEVLNEINPDVVVGFGGYVSAPVYLAAKRARLPLVIHEANAKAGWANRLGARLTRFVGENYPGSLPHAEVVGMPLMRSLIDLQPSNLRASAREHFGFVADRPTLLVTGGSQGARRLNEVTIEALPALEAIGVDVLHICGEANVAEAPVASDRYRPVGFVSEMGLAYSAADYICCRAGATTVAEVGVLGLSALFVPLPIGNGEQHFNAAPLVRAGLAKQVADTDFRHQDLETWVKDLVANPQECRDRSALLKDMVLRDGAERLAGLITRAARFAPVT